MQKTIFIFSFLLIANFSFAQINLVPNFSFEQNDTCPSFGDQIQFATGWSKYSNSASTPDYYNSCSSPNAMGIPKSFWCYQQAHRNCYSYAGLGTWTKVTNQNFREHIGTELSQQLVIGQKYFISFYTVMGEFSSGGTIFGCPSNNIGIRLSTVSYNGNNPVPINNFAHLYSSAIISDSINWVRISGSIIADSAYNYIIVGNFFDDVNTDTIQYNCPSCQNLASYYLVDDICLSTDSLLCNGGIDALPCIVSVNEIDLSNEVNLFPNPVFDIVTLSFQNNLSAEIILYDVFGKIIYSNRIQNENSITINLSSTSSGTYFLKIINLNSNYSLIRKIIKL